MNILILSQVFYPDTVSVAQHMADLAFMLSDRGHNVSVITSKYAYEDKNVKFETIQNIENVNILRLNHLKFGKGNSFGRILEFFTFYIRLFFSLFISFKKFDIIIGSTVPPLLSFVAVIYAKIKGVPFIYWIMDLQPELAVSSNLIRKGSVSEFVLQSLGDFTFTHSTKIISLDRFMTNYIVEKGNSLAKISTIPVWSVFEEECNYKRRDNPFRINNSFGDKIVVMYSGNHAYVHPLDTLLEAALSLKDEDFLFVFVGGGVRKADVTTFKSKYSLNNIVQLPFQQRNKIHISLGSADVQVVVLGNNQVGFTHPNKIYGAMFSSKPILYIGPKESHVTDILNRVPGNIICNHGDCDLLVDQLKAFANLSEDERSQIGVNNRKVVENDFNPRTLKTEMIKVIEN